MAALDSSATSPSAIPQADDPDPDVVRYNDHSVTGHSSPRLHLNTVVGRTRDPAHSASAECGLYPDFNRHTDLPYSHQDTNLNVTGVQVTVRIEDLPYTSLTESTLRSRHYRRSSYSPSRARVCFAPLSYPSFGTNIGNLYVSMRDDKDHQPNSGVSVDALRTSNSMLRQGLVLLQARVSELSNQRATLTSSPSSSTRSSLRAGSDIDRIFTSLDASAPCEAKNWTRVHQIIQKGAEDLHSPCMCSLENVQRDAEPLKKGGFADVYKGSWKGRTVAIKKLHRFNARTEESDIFQDAFSRELLIWQELCHPNILSLLGATQDVASPRLAIVSPWMVHGNVREALYRVDEPPIEHWLKQIAAGLTYLHGSKCTHGDLHGGNILVDESLNIRLTDFGIAAFANPRTSCSNDIGKKVRWMAPELLDGSQPRPNRKTDVYSFASVCIELFTCDIPYGNVVHDADVARLARLGQRPDRPVSRKTNASICDALWELMQQCWVTPPLERPSMAQVMADLQAVL